MLDVTKLLQQKAREAGIIAAEKPDPFTKDPMLAEIGEWLTPRYVFDALDTDFDLDAASSPRKRTPATDHLTRAEDGLKTEWLSEDFVWLSPPHCGREELRQWLGKMYRHNNGIMLWKSTTDTAAFNLYPADSYYAIQGRIKFIDSYSGKPGPTSPSPSMLYAYGGKAVNTLRRLWRHQREAEHQNRRPPFPGTLLVPRR